MAITLSNIQKGQQTLVFEWEGESAEITYRVNAYTPELESDANEKLNDGLPAVSTAAILEKLLIDWDVVGDDGEQLPTDYETLAKFPLTFLSTLLGEISQDQRDNREDRKNSGAGSERKGSSGSARRGTR